ncbi:MAG: flagellar motor protein MotB [Nitrincola lacisaponensis]|uniref:OmpA/MotB family protein n=1 Tax=Nitrincola lacisaponensis TaxID=267850 RepID=UPI0039199CF0
MRKLQRNRARAEEEESVFVTMTDMTISFLLIIMILLAFFATQLNSDETVPLTTYERVRQDRDELRVDNQSLRTTVNALRVQVAELEIEIEELKQQIEKLKVINPLEAYLSQAINQRREILVELRDRLLIEFPELQVVISPEQDALRFQGEGLFRSGSSQLEPRQRAIVETMGRLLDEILICFTLGERANRGEDCGSGNALIEAVQIEGHTDSDGPDLNNLRLSTDRANATLLVMLDEDRSILAHQNLRGQPVMSVSGYGEMRPIETNETIEGKAANRRIDLRIIMYAPSTVEEVEEVGRRLDVLRSSGELE